MQTLLFYDNVRKQKQRRRKHEFSVLDIGGGQHISVVERVINAARRNTLRFRVDYTKQPKKRVYNIITI